MNKITKNGSKIGLVLALIFTAFIGLAGAGSGSGQVTASVGTIFTPTCALTVSGTPTWTQVTPGILTAQSSLATVVTDTGNSNAAISIYGSDWSSATGSVGWTSYSSGAGNLFVGPGTALTSSPTSTGVTLTTPGGYTRFAFGLLIPVGQGTAGMTQTISFVAAC